MRIGCRDKVLDALDDIEDLLEDRKFGLAEIKREIRDIEDALKDRVKDKGPLSTGPFVVEGDHKDRAVTVAVQNLDKCPIDVEVKIFDLECCPPKEVDCKLLKDIGRCCAEAAVFCVCEGIFEVVCCPDPEKSEIRAFVSVHSDDCHDSDVEFVIKAEEMLPLVCPFCKKDKCRRDPCRRCDD